MPVRHRFLLFAVAVIAACSASLFGQQLPQLKPALSPNATPVVGTILTYAGNGHAGFGGDGGPAGSASLDSPSGLTLDAAGNVYFSDTGNFRIREVNLATNIVTTVAGTGSPVNGIVGNGGPATSASLSNPTGLAFDSAGNLYIAESGNDLIRKIDKTTGIISIVAGTTQCFGSTFCLGSPGYSGDGGLATGAQLNNPDAVAFDPSGNLYIADSGNNVIRKVVVGTGIITTVAGAGGGCAAETDTIGDGCPALNSVLTDPQSIAIDAKGNLFIGDANLSEPGGDVRKVDGKTGVITVFAGGGVACAQATDYFGDGCPATEAELDAGGLEGDLVSVEVDASGNLYIGTGALIQRVDASTNIITAAAGNGFNGYSGDGGPATSAELEGPWGIGFDSVGNLYFSQQSNNIIREVVINSTPVTPVPTFSPVGGTYTSEQMVSLSDSLSTATIYYTTDGSAPTTGSTQYTGAIDVTRTTSINAIAAASGYTNSAVGTAAYTIESQAATPVFSPTGGTYTSAQTVTITDSTTGATLYYTTGGSAPTTSSTKYTGPITIGSTETISAIATASGFTNSAVAAAAYTISLPQAAIPSFSPAPGTYTLAQSVTLSDATSGATIYYTTDGSMPTTSSTKYAAAIPVSNTTTINAMAAASGYSNSNVATGVYTINISLPTAATPTFSPAAGTYTSSQSVTIADTTAGATVYYTTDGSTPTTSSAKFTVAITVGKSETINAIATAGGYSSSSVATAAYNINLPAPDFGISLSPTSITVIGGQSGTTTVSIIPENGFSSAVSFACSGQPAGATCNFSPATVTPSAATPTTTLTIATPASTASLGPERNPLIPDATLAAIAFCCVGLRRRRSIQRLMILALCVFGLSWLTGCGDGSRNNGNSGPNPVTSTVIVTGTSGSLQHTATLTLTVN